MHGVTPKVAVERAVSLEDTDFDALSSEQQAKDYTGWTTAHDAAIYGQGNFGVGGNCHAPSLAA
jgi:hypothetical protein